MPLNALIKKDSISQDKEKREIKQLDYSHLDPEIIAKQEEYTNNTLLSLEHRETRVQEMEKEVQEKMRLLKENAEKEAAVIVENARKNTSEELEKSRKEQEDNLRKESEKIVADREELDRQRDTQEREMERFKQDARREIEQEIWEEIQENAVKKADDNFKRLISQIHEILNAAIVKRREIVGSAEKEISELVILIAKKVVKVLSEKDEHVVVKNVVQALEKLKGREQFIIRVNTTNLKELQEFIPKIKAELEIEGKISLVEDTKVDIGGCIIESEFGEIDARIATQLAEIERRIRDTELVSRVEF